MDCYIDLTIAYTKKNLFLGLWYVIFLENG